MAADSRATAPIKLRDTTPRALTDTGNAERLTDRVGNRVRYCYAWGKWLVWTGQRWKVDEYGALDRFAKLTIRAIYSEATDEPDDAIRGQLADHARKSESRRAREAMIVLARSELGIPVRPEELDADPWALNCTNGSVDLHTGQISAHNPANLFTKMTGAEYDPDAVAPTFQAFLERVLPDEGVRGYLQRFLGYACTGVIRDHVLSFWHGSGANGKSTLANVVRSVLGDYAKQAAPELLTTSGHGDRHPTERADLLGARFVASIELDEGKRLAESLVKSMTGGDRMKARFMRSDFIEWTPTHKLALLANHKPTVKGTDFAMWRRIRLVPFVVTIPEAEQDAALPDKLLAEASGILRWLVEGCLAWQREGLSAPEAVVSATEAYREEQDELAEFIVDRCSVGPTERAGVGELYRAYAEWAEAAGEKRPRTKRQLTDRLKERGFAQARDVRGRYWPGIGLAPLNPTRPTTPKNGGAYDRMTDYDTKSGIVESSPQPEGAIPQTASPSVILTYPTNDSSNGTARCSAPDCTDAAGSGLAGLCPRHYVLARERATVTNAGMGE